jgi:hypothetical protein
VLHDEAEVHEKRKAPREAPPAAFSFFPLNSWFLWVPFVRTDPGAPRPFGKLPEARGGHQTEKPPENLEVQVEVVIVLPLAPKSLSDKESDRLIIQEYQIGSMRVLWKGGTM